MLRRFELSKTKSIFCGLVAVAMMFSVDAFASTLFEMKLKSDVQDHTYTITKDGKKPVFKFVFREAGKPTQSKSLTGRQVDQLSAQLTRIAWGSQYRKPASIKTCTRVAQVRVRDDKADICGEDSHLAARIISFANSLRSEFK
ncbi:MAG: hypothetical protein EOP05_08825 [Proteobacteria bacterium]|nr:MAG: hypothetical protein EOP05_08825 [Pseudomonadota bacterium]